MLLDFLFPHYCPVCDTVQDDATLCLGCESQLISLKNGTLPKSTISLLTAGSYRNPGWRSTIYAIKFLGEQRLCISIAQRLTLRKEVRNYIQNTVLVPIPLHPERRAYRGYNQSESIAFGLHSMIPAPIVHILTRQGSATPQSHKASEQKIIQTFTFTVIPSTLPKNTRITLIDDVCTSGTTLRSAVQALHCTGFFNIQCLTLCVG